jgi:hypothetical protein
MFDFVLGDSLTQYPRWPTPTVIVSDGPYGVGGFIGDPTTVKDLPALYEPHIAAWSQYAKSSTVLWFWNTELGWATMHPILERHGWKYHGCNIWNKGIGHVAGNCNGKTMRGFPIVTEVCVQYVRDPDYIKINNLSIQDWLRVEWLRTGMPLTRTNEACGVKNAATRKYFTRDHLFYFPPAEVFERLRSYANAHGRPEGSPYFELPPELTLNGGWERLWYTWKFEYGVSNVWDEPALRGKERIKDGAKTLHLNQKPLALMHRIIRAVCKKGDIVWEPFGGFVSGSVAAIQNGCVPYAAELNEEHFAIAFRRLSQVQDGITLFGVQADIL